jgi:hypothetical protein
VHIANLVRIHEARVAHHVAAIRQVDRQHRAAAKLDVRGPVAVDIRIFGSTKVAAKEKRFDSFEERRISRHHVR